MNRELFQLTLQGFKRKRKTSLLLFLVLCLSFAFAAVSLSVTSSMEATNRNFRLVTYGRWQGAIVESQQGDADFLEQQAWLSGLGTSRQAGMLVGEKGSVNFGTVDEAFIDLGNLGLQNGRWPEKENEIVMEANSLSALGYDYELGQELTVTVSLPATGPIDEAVKVEHTFTLCGVVRAYTGLWEFSQYRQTGTKQILNSAIVTEGTAGLLKQEGEAEAQKLEEQAQEAIDDLKAAGEGIDAALLSQTNIALDATGPVYIFTAKDGMDGEMTETMEEYLSGGAGKRTALSTNKKAYGAADGQEESFQYFYAILVFAVMIFAILCIYALQLPKQVRQIALFRSVGVTKRQLRRMALYENLVLCLPALLLGVGIGAVGTWGALRLLYYSGSAPIEVALPWGLLGILAAAWVLGVFLARIIILQVALREPLTGRIVLSSKKTKRVKRFQTALITVLASLLCGVTVFTVMEALWPLDYVIHSDGNTSYAIYGGGMANFSENTDGGEVEVPPHITPSWRKLAETVPGIRSSEADASFTAEITFDGMEDSDYYQTAMEANNFSDQLGQADIFYSTDALCISLRAVSEEELEKKIDLEALGLDKEAFRRGEEVLVGTQVDVDGSYYVGMPVVEEGSDQWGYSMERRHCKDPVLKTGDTVRLNIYGRPYPAWDYNPKRDHVDLYEFSARAVVVKEDVFGRWNLTVNPYDVVCSYEFLEKAYGEMEPGFDSLNIVTGGEFGYVDLFLRTSSDAGYLATDAVIASMCQEKGFYLMTYREEMAARIQERIQMLILLFAGGGCVLLILLLILGNTFGLEREREKRVYGVLQSLGMSKKQMRRKILKTALFRGVLGAVMGWILFGGYLLADAPRKLSVEALNAAQQNIAPRYTTIWGAVTETIYDLQVDGANLWLVLGLTLGAILVIAGLSLLCKRRLLKDDLMEKLREEK